MQWTSPVGFVVLAGMGSKRRLTNQEQRQETNRVIARSDAVARIFTAICKYGAICFIAWCVKEASNGLSGKQTLAKIGVDVATDFRLNEWLAYALAGGSVVWGLGERRLRRNKVAELAKQTTELEQLVDNNRSSSNLTPRGTTHDRDKV